MKKILSFFAATALLLCFVACGGSKESQPQDNPYIAAHTAGVVSIDVIIKVRFVQSYENTDIELSPKLFKISPSVEGDVYWVDDVTIGFKPKKRLKSATEYKVKFNVGELFSEAAGADKFFDFSFTTVTPSFSRGLDGIHLYDDDDPNEYYFQGTVNVADYTENEVVEKLLQAEVDGKKQEVIWQHTGNYHDFTVEHLTAGDKPYNLILKWTGKPMNYDYTQVDTILIPKINSFEVLDVRVNAENNSIVCRFSLPLDAKQKFASYVLVGDITNLKFSTSSNKLSIFLPTKPTGAVNLVIREGLKGSKGVTLEEKYETMVLFEELKPAVRLMSKGVIMPNSSGFTMPFQAVNLKSVDVSISRIYENNILQFLQVNNLDGDSELNRVSRQVVSKTIRLDENKSLNLRNWNTFSIDFNSIITPEPGAMYRVEIKFERSYSLYSQCDNQRNKNDEDSDMVGSSDEEDGEEEYYYDYWGNRDNPCHPAYYDSYYGRGRFVSQNVLASDIGIIAKQSSDNNYLIFATSLSTAEPISGAKVIFYNYQQQKIVEATTGSNGVAQVDVSATPYVVVVQHGTQKNYLRLNDGMSLSLSSFDVSGTTVDGGLKGTIYGERGVWRPGDTLFLTFVLEDRDKRLPANHPVTFELFNVHNQSVYKQVRTETQNGFYSFVCPTDTEAPTGDWRAVAKVGGTSFSKILRVATIKPNRLKIDTKLDHDPVMHNQNISGSISAKWLHGAKTSGNEADITVYLNPMKTTFKGFDDYSFDDVSKRFRSEGEKGHSGHLNENGTMKFNIPVETNNEAAGKLRASIAIRVFEEGGEFSIDNFSTEIYPYTSYVGLKMPKGIGYYKRLETGKDHVFDVVALDANGKPLQRTLNVEIFRNEWYWWWFSSDGSMADYANRLYENRLFSEKVKTDGQGKGSFTYRLEYPEWGLLLVRVTDPESGHVVTQKAYIDWWGYGRGGDDENSGASVLSFTTDKNKYNVGEKAIVTIGSTDGAKAIVTVENGSKVLLSQRVDCKGNETQITIPTTAEMTPNAYIYITLLQPHAQTKNDLPMRLYGVTPLMVEDPATHLSPEISMSDVIRPEESFKVKVKEKNSKEMTYTLAIVDDGLLDLTRFRTPDLWDYFFQREALGVRTWDLYNFVLGAYGGKIEQLFAIGGDDELSSDDEKGKANRFKPVVKFVGPFTLKGGKTGEHTFAFSNYVGSVRVMVIAGNGFAYGKANKTVPVRSPLMVQATLPRVLGPGEEVTLPATIFAMEKNIKNVKIELKADNMFEPLDGTSRNLTFEETGDELVKFKLKVKNKLGIARVKVIATCGNERAENEIEIDVRAANPPVIVTEEKIISAGQSIDFTVQSPGMAGTNTAELEVSSIPSLNLGQRLYYLLSYPHGCLEQTTSSVFPQLYLPDVIEMTKRDKDRAANNIQAALKRLTYFTKMDGSFSYWPGGTGYGCEWTNNYAGHFMVEAELKGYKIPGNMKENWIAYQQKAARNWSSTTNDRYDYSQSDLIQAYRLYVLALAKKQELSAMNRLKDRSNLSLQAKWMLAGAYALAGQPEAAKKIIENVSVNIKATYNGSSDTYGSADRDNAIVLDVLTLLGNKENAFLMAKQISEAMNANRWMSTQTTAYCLMGISKYALNEKGGLNFAYSINNATSKAVTSAKSIYTLDLEKQEGSSVKAKIENKGNAVVFARVTVKGIPMSGDEKAAEHDLRLKVRYLDANGNDIDVTRLPQGTDFIAEVKVTNPGQRGYYSNLALTQIFPSGWEITDNRLENQQSAGVTYRDIRDDRVYAYFDLGNNKTVTIKVKLRAAYVGKFYLPAVSCEAMYDATINANTVGQSVEVY